jgi:N-acetyl-anhydromuramyl-L-alanine amidase AmpD
MVNGGIVRDGRIEVKIYPNLEHGPMESVSGIILHQTSSDHVIKTMAAYAFRPSGNGAHFLINPAGQIFQTARITQICWHVGRINSYCRTVHKCAPTDNEALVEIETKYGSNKEERTRLIDAREKSKPAQDRYPTNSDSIGIEMVGAPKDDVYRNSTAAQDHSSRWLVTALLATLKLDRARIFPHGVVGAHKLPSEGVNVKY